MKTLLHIIATPRGEDSRTLKVSKTFIEAFNAKNPDWKIEELNLFTEELPSLTVKRINGKYVLLGGKDLSGELKQAWEDIVRHIERFKSKDAYLISTPMWNFSIPYVLKKYIDIIVQPKYLFAYTEKGPEGLLKGKKMFVVTSRGGDYSPGSPFQPFDLQEPYIRNIFGLTGITDITFINAEPMDAMGPKVQEEKVEKAQDLARRIASAGL